LRRSDEQLAWMYASCAGAYEPRHIDVNQPEKFFPVLQQEKISGVLELISNAACPTSSSIRGST